MAGLDSIKKKFASKLSKDLDFDEDSIGKKIETDIQEGNIDELSGDLHELHESAEKTILEHPIKTATAAAELVATDGRSVSGWKKVGELAKEAANRKLSPDQEKIIAWVNQEMTGIEPYAYLNPDAYNILYRYAENLKNNPIDNIIYNNFTKQLDYLKNIIVQTRGTESAQPANNQNEAEIKAIETKLDKLFEWNEMLEKKFPDKKNPKYISLKKRIYSLAKPLNEKRKELMQNG